MTLPTFHPAFLPDTLQRLRLAAGLSQVALADLLHCSGPAVNLWEMGHNAPDAARWELATIKLGAHERYGERMLWRDSTHAELHARTLAALDAVLERARERVESRRGARRA
jgi:transcriptional regulator with XRE-family HTH domain